MLDKFSNIIQILIPAIIIWNLFLHWQIFKLGKKNKLFFSDIKAKDFEGMIAEQIKRLRSADSIMKSLLQEQDKISESISKSIQKVGVVRFNPFNDTGGDQSFSFALLDQRNNGLVISSLYTREGVRVFSKPIEKGLSKYGLSKEEKEAIKKAIGS